MRLIGTLPDESQAILFSAFLKQKKITHQIEIRSNNDWGSPEYGTASCQVWITDEDQTEEAVQLFSAFQQNPFNPLFQPPPLSTLPPPPPEMANKPQAARQNAGPLGWVTRFFIGLCTFLFVFDQFSAPAEKIPQGASMLNIYLSPINNHLIFDYPKFFELLTQFVQTYGINGLQNPSDLNQEGQALLHTIEKTPVWKGVYNMIAEGNLNQWLEGKLQAPLFEKIREGQIWRLFTPALLHGDLFHLFFNMIWLLVLGKQMEQKIKPGRTIAFILIVGILSNIAQYLVSGPNFLGFSGVLCGMLAFVWVRQKNAPWEGYQVDRLTFAFMLIFICGMALLQLISLMMEVFFDISIPLFIANTAHLAGGVAGYFLGKLTYFKWRPSKRVG
ncbi:MAG: rhomboid family intramembrane serine protease [Parachlamydia sp.]|jgi:GlpG protein|nr:rhomboid family intramembrane serine protease [Parachlamydia sp.]